MSIIIKRNKKYIVKSKYGTFSFNNLKTAQELDLILTDYEYLKITKGDNYYKSKTIEKHVGIIEYELKQLRKEIKE